jgi:hypothetical protein
MCRQTDKDGCDKEIVAFQVYAIMPKNSNNKGAGWMKQLNCTECGVSYVDDVHKQLRVFHCRYGEM